MAPAEAPTYAPNENPEGTVASAAIAIRPRFKIVVPRDSAITISHRGRNIVEGLMHQELVIDFAVDADAADASEDDGLAEIYELDKQNPRLAVDAIIDRIDGLQNDGRFIDCREFIASLSVAKLSGAALVSVLLITLAAKDKLAPERNVFYKHAVAAIAMERGQDGAEALLSKYR